MSITNKKCSMCDKIKNANEFYVAVATGKLYSQCIECDRSRRLVKNMTPQQIEMKRSRERVVNVAADKLEIKRARQRKEKKEWYNSLTEEQKDKYNAKRRIANLTDEKAKQKREKRKIKNASPKRLTNIKKSRKTPLYKLRKTVSVMIGRILKNNGSNKNGQSISQFLPQTISKIKSHIEILFGHPSNLTSEGKIWMTWENHGKYDSKTWNDNDYSTQKWQLDHIIPQSDLPYTSMEDENFKKCWALENLRPLSAKQNSIDGAKRTRHSKIRE